MMEKDLSGGRNQASLHVRVGPLGLKNPVLVASGTFGYGREFADLVPVKRLGAVVVKSVTTRPRLGNPQPRVCETASGMINSIGLENPGIERFLGEILPELASLGTAVIVNVAGSGEKDFAFLAGKIDAASARRDSPIRALELNLSCPNVAGGMDFATKPRLTRSVVRACHRRTSLPLIAKLTPNVSDICLLAEAALEGGADILSLSNTVLAMAVDWRRRRPEIATVTGGLSGPCVKPISLRLVWQVWKRFRCPVLGIGGIMSAEDVLEYLVAGASAVQVGTANFVDPRAAVKILDDLPRLLREGNARKVSHLVGTLQTPPEMASH